MGKFSWDKRACAIALGLDASSDRVRAQAVCPQCSKRGAQTYMPSHANSIVGREERHLHAAA